VSIVTPSYNQGEFIEETIRSVLLQGYPDLEYMIIDGGSTDNSVEIVRRYEPWLAHWVSEPDRGQAHAINKGWKRVQGEVISYLNSDDVLASKALGKVTRAFVESPETALVYGDCNLVDARGQVVQALRSWPYNRARLLLGNYIHQPSAFLRRMALERIGLLDETYHMTMDYDYWVRVAVDGLGMTYLPEVLSQARLAAGTKTCSLSTRYLEDTLRVLNAVYDAPDVPGDLGRVKRKAYGNAWRLGGVRHFDANNRRLALTAMRKSLTWDPFPGWQPLAVTTVIALQAALGVHWWSSYTLEKAGPASRAVR
jgi:glycosyltransferase involved in cell wall biosynthesis